MGRFNVGGAILPCPKLLGDEGAVDAADGPEEPPFPDEEEFELGMGSITGRRRECEGRDSLPFVDPVVATVSE